MGAEQPWVELFHVLDQDTGGVRESGRAEGRKSGREREGREVGRSDIAVMSLMIKPWP